ncbi:uncharacterized protein LOC118348521 [Juglans regia]|uniref:Uncharacterized protein LOC118348521 n=1 Tax=Juglans regia TaxID=51240 RepID=A0A6P9EDJ4_JUGRE|nr:uncharacterized protein LOC118348521 [Juglans regia]
MQDMALKLMERCPRLAFALDRRGVTPFEVLAVSTDGVGFWKQWIYNHFIHINSSAGATDHVRLNINQDGREKTIGSVGADLWRQLVSSLFNLLAPCSFATHVCFHNPAPPGDAVSRQCHRAALLRLPSASTVPRAR